MSASDLEQRFEEQASLWEAHLDAERASSNPFSKIQHPAFEDIVALGEPAVPLIIERYRNGSAFWGAALARITGIEEHGDGVTGNVKQTRQRWLAWWEEKTPR